ncbi:hypothetical protein AWC38_SpisGene7327 [Stylophora pistillata]|uniref:receptor protein-tyrosine kinase n=2 Tax=Stylophora pistillata TaxID=50429 RepID=A0A2B4SFW3_STYPI|nr:hypothetical protein AWC38_SpisGene7327 [Stylophora pistillata]
MDSVGLEDNLRHEEGFVFSRFSKDNEDDCQWRSCQNNGVCAFDKQHYACSCHVPWTGSFCETKLVWYNFTSLGAEGRNGPESNAGHRGTGLRDVQVIDGKQEWIVPFTGRFQVEACGASGGKGFQNGGRGAKINGIVLLEKGVKLVILVGQKGVSPSGGSSGSGGGGTFVVYSPQMRPLLVAGGGGGGRSKYGLPGNDQVNGSGNAGGGIGEGGRICVDPSKGIEPDSGTGAGINGSGGCFDRVHPREICSMQVCNKGGKSFIAGGKGGEVAGCDGGFGGGGACNNFAGGGGGYTGGGIDFDEEKGGGGGSYVENATWSITKGGCDEGDGYVSFHNED